MLTGQNGILNRTAIEEENGIRAVIPNGFYIARYEAGLPADENLWAWKNNAIYGCTNGKDSGSLDGNRNENIGTMTPVSKKNNASWNRVSQTNAVKLSKKCMKEVQQ